MNSLCKYAIVEQVQIEAVTDTEVTFATRADDGMLRSFTCGRAEIFMDPEDAVLLAPGEVGILYLSREGWTVTSDGHQIFGAGDDTVAVFKWPECAGALVSYLPETVRPQSIVISGMGKARGTAGAPGTPIADLDIWCNGERAQAIHWNGAGYLRIELAPGMVDGLAGEVEVWPTKLVVRGEMEEAPGRLLEVDLLDRLLAKGTQDLVWESGSSTITVHLTPAGSARFIVIPELIIRPVSLRRITIVGMPAPDASEPNDFLARVHEQVSQGTHPGKREVYRASSVLDIQQILLEVLASTPLAKISLQLISHANSGILWLGRYGEVSSDASPFFYLDADPDALVYLSQFGRDQNLSDVTVVGCDVGAATDIGNAYNGRILMYTLAELLRCKVVGATDAVHWSEFDARGDYVPDPRFHSGPAGWQWHPDREPQRISGKPARLKRAPGASRSFSVTAIHAASLPVAQLDQPLDPSESFEIEGKQERDRALWYLAPEISVAVRPEGSSMECEGAVLRGGQFLRVEGAHYRIEQGTRLCRTLLRPSGGSPVRPVAPAGWPPAGSDSAPPVPPRRRRFSQGSPAPQ